MKELTNAYSLNDLISLFLELGIKKDYDLLFHTSLSSFGTIIGGSQTFLDALIEVVGNGVLLTPYQCSIRGEPASFLYPPLSLELQKKWREEMPAFDPLKTDAYHMSITSSSLLRREGAILSNSPINPFVLFGKDKELYKGKSDLAFSLGKDSPLDMLLKRDGYILLAGVDYDNMTALHFCEYESKYRPLIIDGTAIKENNEKIFKSYLERDLDSDDGHFMAVGKRLEKNNKVKMIPLIKVNLKLIQMKDAYYEAMNYFKEIDPYHK